MAVPVGIRLLHLTSYLSIYAVAFAILMTANNVNNLMFIGPCIIVIVEEWKTKLMSLAVLFHFLWYTLLITYYILQDIGLPAHCNGNCSLQHTYIHTRIHTYTHTYIHTCKHTYIHTYTHTHTYVHTYIHNTYIHTHTYIHIYIHKYIDLYCAYIRIYFSTQAYINIHSHLVTLPLVTNKNIIIIIIIIIIIKELQKTATLGTAHILRKVLM